MAIWIKAPLLGVLLSGLLVACNSSGPAGNNPINTTTTGGDLIGASPYVTTGINGALKGDIWSAESGTRLNLDTGELKFLSKGLVYPRADGREYAELFLDFQQYSTSGCGGYPTKSSAIFLRDTASGIVNDSLEVLAKLRGPLLISPDGERLALWATDDNVCSSQDEYFVTLLSRDGRILAEGSERVVGYDWMPDSRLAFMVLKDGVYALVIESQPNTFSGLASAELPELEGSASRFRISPDGEQVLIEVVTHIPLTLSGLQFRDASIWQMNIDGSNFRKLIDTSRISPSDNTSYEVPRVNAPVWSPDGSNLLATEDYILGAAVTYYGTETENLTYVESVNVNAISDDSITYVMPTDSELQRLPPTSYSATGVRPLFGRDAQGKNGILGINPIGRQVWTPAIAPSTTVGGGFLAPSGQTNRGLSGVLYDAAIREDGAIGIPIEMTDLVSAGVRTVGLNIDDDSTYASGFDVTSNGGRMAALHLDSALVNTYDDNGQLLESYSQTTSNYDYKGKGRIKFSPLDEDVVAWVFAERYSSIEGVVVLNTDTGRFVDVFEDQDYDTFAFMPNGDLLLVSANKVFLASQSLTGFLEPELAFVHNEYLEHVSVRADGNRLAFSSQGRIFTIDPDGSNVTKVTAASAYFFEHPEWSPDGNTLVFRGTHAEKTYQFANYFVAADAQNVALYDDYIQPNIMKLGEASGKETTDIGFVLWR